MNSNDTIFHKGLSIETIHILPNVLPNKGCDTIYMWWLWHSEVFYVLFSVLAINFQWMHNQYTGLRVIAYKAYMLWLVNLRQGTTDCQRSSWTVQQPFNIRDNGRSLYACQMWLVKGAWRSSENLESIWGTTTHIANEFILWIWQHGEVFPLEWNSDWILQQ